MTTNIEPVYERLTAAQAAAIAAKLSLRKSQNKLVWKELGALQDDENRHSRHHFPANRNLVWLARRKLIELNS